MDYTDQESYDCPVCSWSLRVNKGVWSVAQHSTILTYIHNKVREHALTHEHFEIEITRYVSPYLTFSEEKE